MHLARLDEKNTVVELIDLPDGVDPATAFHSSLRIVRASEAAQIGSVWDGRNFSAVVINSESRLSKEDLRARSRLYRVVKFESMKVKVGDNETWVDSDTLTNISSKIDMIDKGIIQQPIHFKLASGFAMLSRDELFDIQRTIAEYMEKLFKAEASVNEAIDKGRVKNQEQLEAAFAAKIQ